LNLGIAAADRLPPGKISGASGLPNAAKRSYSAWAALPLLHGKITSQREAARRRLLNSILMMDQRTYRTAALLFPMKQVQLPRRHFS
jgi:hypothetical protein